MPRKKTVRKVSRRSSEVKQDKKNLLLFLAVVGSILLLVVVLIRTPKPETFDNASTAGLENATISPIEGEPVTYSGLLPCADCEGIETDLVLYLENDNDTTGEFRKSETYLGRSEMPLLSKGSFTRQVGASFDPEAVVYILVDTQNNTTNYYLVVDENTLEQLDSNMERIDSGLNYSLELQQQ